MINGDINVSEKIWQQHMAWRKQQKDAWTGIGELLDYATPEYYARAYMDLVKRGDGK